VCPVRWLLQICHKIYPATTDHQGAIITWQYQPRGSVVR
jgi:hypothetical protein